MVFVSDNFCWAPESDIKNNYHYNFAQGCLVSLPKKISTFASCDATVPGLVASLGQGRRSVLVEQVNGDPGSSLIPISYWFPSETCEPSLLWRIIPSLLRIISICIFFNSRIPIATWNRRWQVKRTAIGRVMGMGGVGVGRREPIGRPHSLSYLAGHYGSMIRADHVWTNRRKMDLLSVD